MNMRNGARVQACTFIISVLLMEFRARQGDLFRVEPRLPEGFVYRPEFITAEEEQVLLTGIRELAFHEARYKQYTARRRIASFGSQYDFSKMELAPAPSLPSFLLPLREKVAAWLDIPAQEFAHALVTEYRQGTPLGWHRDTPEFQVVVGVSLLAPCRMRLRPYPPAAAKRKDVVDVELEPRSAYVIRGPARWRWQHSIPATKALRYSITFRTSARHAA